MTRGAGKRCDGRRRGRKDEETKRTDKSRCRRLYWQWYQAESRPKEWWGRKRGRDRGRGRGRGRGLLQVRSRDGSEKRCRDGEVDGRWMESRDLAGAWAVGADTTSQGSQGPCWGWGWLQSGRDAHGGAGRTWVGSWGVGTTQEQHATPTTSSPGEGAVVLTPRPGHRPRQCLPGSDLPSSADRSGTLSIPQPDMF